MQPADCQCSAPPANSTNLLCKRTYRPIECPLKPQCCAVVSMFQGKVGCESGRLRTIEVKGLFLKTPRKPKTSHRRRAARGDKRQNPTSDSPGPRQGYPKP